MRDHKGEQYKFDIGPGWSKLEDDEAEIHSNAAYFRKEANQAHM